MLHSALRVRVAVAFLLLPVPALAQTQAAPPPTVRASRVAQPLRIDGKLDEDEIHARVQHLNDLVSELTAERAEERIGSTVEVLVEEVDPDGTGDGTVEGRAAQQGPEVDGTTRVLGVPHARVGDLVAAVVVASDGVDLIAEPAGGAS